MTSDETDATRWRREQVRIDDGSADPLPPVSGDAAGSAQIDEEQVAATADEHGRGAAWNKGQMAIDDGGDPQPWIDPDVMPESEAGPTGGRASDSGGERFGNIDDDVDR